MALIKSCLASEGAFEVVSIKATTNDTHTITFSANAGDLIFAVSAGGSPTSFTISGGTDVTSDYSSVTDASMNDNFAMIEATGSTVTLTTPSGVFARCIQIRA